MILLHPPKSLSFSPAPLPEESGEVSKEEEGEDSQASPPDQVFLWHIGLLFDGVQLWVLIQNRTEMSQLSLDVLGHAFRIAKI